MRIRVLFVVAITISGMARADSVQSLEVWPTKVRLTGPATSQRLIVVGVLADGSRRDLTESARVHSSNTNIIAVDGNGRVTPNGDGEGSVVVRAGGIETTVAVEIVGSTAQRRVSFRHEIEPILTKRGCNMGACHGGQHGKGGFRLSLLGFEAAPDYTSIVKSAEGRRVTPFAPEESLLLLKPTLAIAHGGGKRIDIRSADYETIRLWLEEGVPGLDDTEPSVIGLHVDPPSRVLRPGDAQRYVVTAELSDGSVSDVTDHAKFDSLNDAVAIVSEVGIAKVERHGETNVLARYQGHAALARMSVPYGPSKPFAWTSHNVIDDKAAAKWRELGLVPSPSCTDAEFLRRVMLDAIGSTPTLEEVETFLADFDPKKRDKLVDRVLDRPEYVDYWTLKWGDLLRVNSVTLGAQGMLAFNLWLRESFRSNKPFDRMIEELVTAQGSIYSSGPANYYRVASNPADLAETTAQLFMGVRLQCAKCHHHPFEAYGQDDYYGLAAYFARIRTKSSDEFGLFGREQVIFVNKTGEINQPRTGKRMTPRPLNAPPADDPIDRRRALAKWLV